MNNPSLLKRSAIATVVLLAAVLLTSAAAAQDVPQVLPYQGFVSRGDGAAVDGFTRVTFKLYANPDDTTPLWTETHTDVPVAKGVFYVYLGMQLPLIEHFNDGTTRYLGIAINDDPEATPRQEIGSVPYALLADNALTLGGFSVDYFATQGDLVDLVTATDLTNYVTQEQLAAFNFVTGDTITNFNFVTQTDLTNYVTQNDLTNYVTQDDLTNYVTQDQLTNYVTQDDLTNYVTRTDFNTTVTDLQTQIDDLRTRLDNLEANGGGVGVRGEILGVSNQSISSAISFNGRTGLAGADALCRASYANVASAHLCSETEVQRALGSQSFSASVISNINNVATWTVGYNNFGDTRTPNESVQSGCWNLLYGSGHIGRGTTLTVSFNQAISNGQTGNYYNIRRNQGCGASMPVLCCR